MAMSRSESGALKQRMEHRRSFLVLRWLLVILATYLAVFSRLPLTGFDPVSFFALAFVLTNVACELIPERLFDQKAFQQWIGVVDAVFVTGTFYALRVPDNYLYVPFVLVFLLAAAFPDLKVVFFSIMAVSILFGVFAEIRMNNLDSDFIEPFLKLALFFVVSIFYVFLADWLRRDAFLSATILEEKRRAEMMAEVTQSFSSSLNSGEILYLIVTRLCEETGAKECLIVGTNSKDGAPEIMVRSSDPEDRGSAIDLDKYPELVQAYRSGELVFLPNVARDGIRESAIAVPMVFQDSVTGVIQLRLEPQSALGEADARFLKSMAGTAANALRNAQLFEEVEHRARTDFLTGLPNHRFFQTTLATELARAQRHNRTLSLLIVDLDFLKDVNDRFGHPTGDTVIRAVAETIRGSCRDFDFAARYGGEEFTVILPETPLQGAIHVAERIRERIAAIPFPSMGSGVTDSIGVANYPVNALWKEDLIRVADRALYVAKNGGRDRVASFNYQLLTL
jgi:diguanylate cyclase (GGDEF)-like protein